MPSTGTGQILGQRGFPEDLEENVMTIFDRATGVTRKMVHASGGTLSP